MKKHLLLFFLPVSIVVACKDDPVSIPLPPSPGTVVRGVYVLNEGNFGDPTGARLSLYDIDRDTAFIDVFESANNGSHLGSLGDDIAVFGGNAYVLMSGSENLVVVRLSDHKMIQSATYPGADPHDLLIDSLRARIYVTRLFSSSVLIIDLTTLAVLDSITVGANPQGMIISGNRLYVCNSGFGGDRTVSCIDLATLSVISTLAVGDGPTKAAMAQDGTIWVICTGNSFGAPPTTGGVYLLDPNANTVVDSMLFSENLWVNIAMSDDGHAYVHGVTAGSFLGGPIHRINTTTMMVTPAFVAGTFYGMGVDPLSGDLYLSDAKNLTSDGEVSIYSSDGVFKKKFNVQKGPGGFAFR